MTYSHWEMEREDENAYEDAMAIAAGNMCANCLSVLHSTDECNRNHNVLVDTLRLAYQRLRTFSPSFPEYKRDWTGDDSDAVEVIENVLQQEERA